MLFFFFSSRRRHTRLQGDWSSDVCSSDLVRRGTDGPGIARSRGGPARPSRRGARSEEHTSELQSPCNLVCRLLLEKKKDITTVKPFTWQRATVPRPPCREPVPTPRPPPAA